ncbi:uncharacterized protein LOC120336058 [Styela clava]
MDSIKEIISGYEGNEEAEKIIEFLKIEAPALLLLCTTPVMLVYTLIALKFKSDFKPNTMSGIMIVVMQSILRSPHTHQEITMEVLDKLKELSYIGTLKQRVLFTEDDFRQVHLKPEEATDLAILAPGGIYQIQDLEEKRDILKKSLQLQLNKRSNKSDLLELFAALNEAKSGMSDIVKSSLDKINMYDHPLSISDVHVIGSVAYYCTSLIMDFRRCDLKSSSLQTLASGLKGSNVKIMELELSGNTNMGVEGLSTVGQILSNQSCVEYLGLSYCNLSSDQLQALKSSLGTTEIMKLGLSGNTNMGVEGLSTVGQILSNQSCVEDLELSDCNLSSDQLQAFKSSLGNTEIKQLGLYENTNMGVEGLSSVGQILSNQSCVKYLGLGNCNLSSDQLQAFKSSLGNTEVLEIRLGMQLLDRTLKSQSKSADATTNVFSKQLPTTTSKAEFVSPYDSFENTGENVETLQEIRGPRSELPLSEEEAEQSDKEVTEQFAKRTQHTL